MAWTRRLLADTGVALAPGIDFDTVVGQQHVRLSFAGPEQDVRTGLERLGDWLPAQRSTRRPGDLRLVNRQVIRGLTTRDAGKATDARRHGRRIQRTGADERT